MLERDWFPHALLAVTCTGPLPVSQFNIKLVVLPPPNTYVATVGLGYNQLSVYEPVMLLTSTLNSIPCSLAHHVDGIDVIAPGALGAPFTVIQRDALVPQPLLAVTQTVPVVKVPMVMLMALLPWPLFMVDPEGPVQLNVDPACDGQVYISVCPHKPFSVPLMDAGTVGTPLYMVVLRGADVCPQTVVLVTLMLPPLNVGPKVTFMQFELELPVAPGGKVQL